MVGWLGHMIGQLHDMVGQRGYMTGQLHDMVGRLGYMIGHPFFPTKKDYPVKG
jgi:hypothetical protein